VFFRFSVFFFSFQLFKRLLQKNVELPPWYGQWQTLGMKPVFRCSKPHTYSTLIGEENENQIYSYIFFLGHLEHGQSKQQQQQQQTKTSTFEK